LNGDGLTCSIPQLTLLLASTPQTWNALKLNAARFEGLAPLDYFDNVSSHVDVQVRRLPDGYFFRCKSKSLSHEANAFLSHAPVDWVYEPVLQYLYRL
jgi:hypothetical protein